MHASDPSKAEFRMPAKAIARKRAPTTAGAQQPPVGAAMAANVLPHTPTVHRRMHRGHGRSHTQATP